MDFWTTLALAFRRTFNKNYGLAVIRNPETRTIYYTIIDMSKQTFQWRGGTYVIEPNSVKRLENNTPIIEYVQNCAHPIRQERYTVEGSNVNATGYVLHASLVGAIIAKERKIAESLSRMVSEDATKLILVVCAVAAIFALISAVLSFAVLDKLGSLNK